VHHAARLPAAVGAVRAAAGGQLLRRDCSLGELGQHRWTVMDQLSSGEQGALRLHVQQCEDGAHLRDDGAEGWEELRTQGMHRRGASQWLFSDDKRVLLALQCLLAHDMMQVL